MNMLNNCCRFEGHLFKDHTVHNGKIYFSAGVNRSYLDKKSGEWIQITTTVNARLSGNEKFLNDVGAKLKQGSSVKFTAICNTYLGAEVKPTKGGKAFQPLITIYDVEDIRATLKASDDSQNPEKPPF